MQQRSDLYTLPDDLPVPTDDGACDHLARVVLPSIPLSSTDGEQILSDSDLVFTRTLRLPTFEFEPYGEESSTLLKRMALVIRDGRIEKVFYPVFPPHRNAEDVMEWLRTNA
jgi:hypothetical protein